LVSTWTPKTHLPSLHTSLCTFSLPCLFLRKFARDGSQTGIDATLPKSVNSKFLKKRSNDWRSKKSSKSLLRVPKTKLRSMNWKRRKRGTSGQTRRTSCTRNPLIKISCSKGCLKLIKRDSMNVGRKLLTSKKS